MTGWWVPLVLAVVVPVVGWAAIEYRKPAPDPEGEALAAGWEALGAQVRAERGSIADDIDSGRTDVAR